MCNKSRDVVSGTNKTHLKTNTVLPENFPKNKGKLGTWGLIMHPLNNWIDRLLRGDTHLPWGSSLPWPTSTRLTPHVQLPTDVLEARASRISVISVGSGA